MEQIEVYNLGICGAASADIIETELPQALGLTSDLYVLLVGTNDMLRKSGTAISLELYEQNMRHLISVLSEKARVIVLTIPPNVEMLEYSHQPPDGWKNGSPKERILTGNRILKKLTDEADIPLRDIYKIFSAYDLDSMESPLINQANSGDPDGTHPTSQGYRLMAEEVFNVIKNLGEIPRRVVCLGDSITCGAKMIGQGTADGETYPAYLKRLLENELAAKSL